jgi:hypothetical protein
VENLFYKGGIEMITLEDVLLAKEQNEKVIADLQAENRAFDKLIAIEKSKEVSEQNEENQVNEVTDEQPI